MKFWDRIIIYQINSNIEREELKRKVAIDELKSSLFEKLRLPKLVKFLDKIICKFKW